MFFSNPESDRIFERTLLRLEFQTLAGFSLKAGAKISTFLAFLQTFHNFFSIFTPENAIDRLSARFQNDMESIIFVLQREKCMKHLLIYIGMACAAASCTPARPKLQSGDLLFEAGAGSAMSEAIRSATGSARELSYTHVGIAVVNGGADSVLEATSEGGVRMTTLEEFLEGAARIDGAPAVTAARLRDTSGLAASLNRALQHLGEPYDYSYRPDNGKMYCSELVWESYRRPSGERIFPARPMNFRDEQGELPRYWRELYERLGEEVPEGVPGTNPNEMARDSALRITGHFFRFRDR